MVPTEKQRRETIDTHHLRAFAFEGGGGNLAGVTIDLEEKMTDKERQSLAKELGYSESAFVLPSSVADVKILFYTSMSRVAMCGHATLATWYQLFTDGKAAAGTHTQEIVHADGRSDILTVTIDTDGIVYTELQAPVFKKNIDPRPIATVLHMSEDVIGGENLHPQIVNTGFDELLIPISRQDIFQALLYEKLKEADLRAFQEQYGVEGIFAFCLNSDDDRFKAMVKNSDPMNGMYPYDNATGTGNGALLCYLLEYDVVTPEQATKGMWVKQFGIGGAVSRLIVKAEMKDKQIEKLWVGGSVIAK